MPISQLQPPSLGKTVIRPIIYKIAEDVRQQLGIQTSERFIYNEEFDIAATDNQSNDKILDPDNIPKTNASSLLFVEVDNEYNEDNVQTIALTQGEHYPIFIDREIGFIISPQYVKSDLTFTFRYSFTSRSKAVRARDRARMIYSNANDVHIHTVEYNYLIPSEIEDLIGAVYDNKARLTPGLTLTEYFKSHGTQRFHLMTDFSPDKSPMLAVYESQTRIQGIYDFILPEKIEKDNENHRYNLTISYKVSLDIPRFLLVTYPVMVYNKPLPAVYLKHIEEFKRSRHLERHKSLTYSLSFLSFSKFEAHRELDHYFNLDLPLTIPLFDDFKERSFHTGYATTYSFLVSIDENDKKSLLDVNEMGDYSIHPKVLKYIQDVELTQVFEPYQSLLYIGLHQKGKYFNANELQLDGTMIKSRKELDLKRETRVLFNVLTDFTYLNENAIKRMLDYAVNVDPEPLYIMFTDHMRAYLNFKDVFNKSNPYGLTPVVRKYIYFLYEIFKTGRYDILERILTLLSIPTSLYMLIMDTMKSEFKLLLDDFKKNNIQFIDMGKDMKLDHRSSLHTANCKTVQIGFIIADRRDK